MALKNNIKTIIALNSVIEEIAKISSNLTIYSGALLLKAIGYFKEYNRWNNITQISSTQHNIAECFVWDKKSFKMLESLHIDALTCNEGAIGTLNNLISMDNCPLLKKLSITFRAWPVCLKNCEKLSKNKIEKLHFELGRTGNIVKTPFGVHGFMRMLLESTETTLQILEVSRKILDTNKRLFRYGTLLNCKFSCLKELDIHDDIQNIVSARGLIATLRKNTSIKTLEKLKLKISLENCICEKSCAKLRTKDSYYLSSLDNCIGNYWQCDENVIAKVCLSVYSPVNIIIINNINFRVDRLLTLHLNGNTITIITNEDVVVYMMKELYHGMRFVELLKKYISVRRVLRLNIMYTQMFIIMTD